MNGYSIVKELRVTKENDDLFSHDKIPNFDILKPAYIEAISSGDGELFIGPALFLPRIEIEESGSVLSYYSPLVIFTRNDEFDYGLVIITNRGDKTEISLLSMVP